MASKNAKELLTLAAVLALGATVSLSLKDGAPRAGVAPLVPTATLRTNGFLGEEIKEIPAPPANFNPAVPQPELSAHAYLVRLIGDEYPLLRQREWKALPPASLSKLLTAVIAKEELSPFLWITFTKKTKEVEEKLSQAEAGETFIRDDVLRMLLIESANDAALLLADAVGTKHNGRTLEEKLEIFSGLANAKAEELGLVSTNVENPTGLDANTHLASAGDLAKLAEYIWSHHPKIWEVTRSAEAAVYSETGKEFRLKNTNLILEEFPAILGGKTGFTDNAKESLLFLYPASGSRIAIVVILGSEDRFEDGRKVIQWLEESFN